MFVLALLIVATGVTVVLALIAGGWLLLYWLCWCLEECELVRVRVGIAGCVVGQTEVCNIGQV